MNRYKVRVIRETIIIVECETEEQIKDEALKVVDEYGFESYIDILDEFEVAP